MVGEPLCEDPERTKGYERLLHERHESEACVQWKSQVIGNGMYAKETCMHVVELDEERSAVEASKVGVQSHSIPLEVKISDMKL